MADTLAFPTPEGGAVVIDDSADRFSVVICRPGRPIPVGPPKYHATLNDAAGAGLVKSFRFGLPMIITHAAALLELRRQRGIV